jgi:CheY-like chemotaxis protein
MNGYETTKAIKVIRPDLPVIAQTAYAMEDDYSRSLAMGCDDYISKPIDKNVLFEKLNNYLYINKNH